LGCRYETWASVPRGPEARYVDEVEKVAEDAAVKRICDIGGGANPLLSFAQAEAAGIEEYVVTDIEAGELAKAPPEFTKVVADASAPWPEGIGSFDLVVSRFVAEHVPDPAAFHRTVFELLRPGGRAMHFFPTLYEPAFVFNRLAPEALSAKLLNRAQEGREEGGNHQKFPAYYRWCRGATKAQLGRLRSIGFSVDDYLTVFGHGYLWKVPPLERLVDATDAWLCDHRFAQFGAYAAVTLSRPAAEVGGARE
jgi:SAM-dependent methyltransferase